MPADSTTGRQPARVAGRWPALMLAVAVHVVFIAVLIFSVRWQNKKPEPVSAELYAPPTKAPAVERPPPPPPPKPISKAPPEPEPAVEPPPKAIVKPPPPIETPNPHAPEIALKAKQEEDRRRREQAELERKEIEKREVERRDAEKREAERREVEKREAERKRLEEQRRVAETRERQAREAEALRAQADRETQLRVQPQQAAREAQLRAQAEREMVLRAQAEREAQVRAQQADAAARAAAGQQQAAARGRALDEYIHRIRTKVRANVIEPGEIPGNPEAIFEVVQLPTGEIIDVKLRKSSGFRAYDEAVQRAILKSSPLPRPAQPDLWERVLELKFKPRE